MAKKRNKRNDRWTVQAISSFAHTWRLTGSSAPLPANITQVTAFIEAVWESACVDLRSVLETLGYRCRPDQDGPHHWSADSSQEQRAHRHQELIRYQCDQLLQLPCSDAGATPKLARTSGGLDYSLTNIALGMTLHEMGIPVKAMIHCDRLVLTGDPSSDAYWYVDVRSRILSAFDMRWERREGQAHVFCLLDPGFRLNTGAPYEVGIIAPLVEACTYWLLRQSAASSVGAVGRNLSALDPSTPLTLCQPANTQHPLVAAAILAQLAVLGGLFPGIGDLAQHPDFVAEQLTVPTRRAMDRLMHELVDPQTGQVFAQDPLFTAYLECLSGVKIVEVLPVIIDGNPPPPVLKPVAAAYFQRLGRALLAAGPVVWNRELDPVLVGKIYARSLREPMSPGPDAPSGS